MRTVTFTANNHITLLNSGMEYFPELIAAFDQAKEEIWLETYIFALDETGEDIKAALERAARRGVQVQVITDWIGTGNAVSKQLTRDLSAAGAQHCSFNPWFKRGVARTHRKMCVVDRAVAFLGGLNINNDFRADDDPEVILPAPRWDFAVRIEGALVRAIHREIEIQWARLHNTNLKARWQRFKDARASRMSASVTPARAALVIRDNLRNRRTIQRSYLQALGRARKSAWLANPYFAPGRKLRVALASAASRGVDVTLLLGVGQYRLQDAVAQSFYPKLLAAGVRIVEFRKTQLHGKVAVIDDDWATVGSSNYDGFSLFVNQEANIVVKDADFAQALRRHIEAGIQEGVEIRLQEFANTPWYRRAWYGFAYLLYKSVLRMITWGRYVE
ncbi:MAG: phospholipase D-like domain-containing protein [Burkholderiaceae bacterium]